MEPKPGMTTRRWPDHRPGTLRVEEVAQILGIGRTSVYAQIKAGKIPSLKFGRARRISQAVIDRMLAEGVVGS